MAKSEFTDEDDALLAELGIEVEIKNTSSHTPREERIIAGFEEIERFIETNGRLPQHGESNDIFERLYAVRLDQIRASNECKTLLEGMDKHGLLTNNPQLTSLDLDTLDDDALLAELGVSEPASNDITQLKFVKSRAERKAAEEVAQRSFCEDFENFKRLFDQVQDEIKAGERKTMRFKEDASINPGEFFILNGQLAFVAESGETIKAPNGEADARMRVIYDNQTESNILRRSFQRALYKDEAGRRVSEPNAGPLFDNVVENEDVESGTIYVLRSKSDHPEIASRSNVLHKIGVTGGSIAVRIANAKVDPTFLMAEVEVVATYELYNINRIKLENLIHRFLNTARLKIHIKDRFGNPIYPREWFLVPLFIIDEMVEKIKDGTLSNYEYNVENAKLELNS
ncbi:GIY-YIG nuclease family protein [Methylophilus sp. Leaf408]|uniref:GIY-YIG nuclease family protein n=1 Tax=Methylophilus sp. Leaf408 TaxID=2876561 RepID=UPI001E4C1209|nr:GIY-YIG nuclease family protein [Methylophilus sp. Leaf408]